MTTTTGSPARRGNAGRCETERLRVMQHVLGVKLALELGDRDAGLECLDDLLEALAAAEDRLTSLPERRHP
ncbi:hypothetical protein [Nocardioides sp. GXZ039]|uniref:hypothetical protein n=1 Tax=Nocardioides sp. GXZ039 TaxID=3136018 RepID=UPI0030F46080